MKTYTIKKLKYKDKTFKFKEPLKITINNFLFYDLKTKAGELSIPSINDGYTDKEIKNPDKEIKNYLTYIFDLLEMIALVIFFLNVNLLNVKFS